MTARSGKRPSLGDVARLAGVSPQTVSRVSTGSDLVNAETETRVRLAMQELGYRPNLAARALRHGSYKALGVVVQKLERTGESLATAAIVDTAAKHGYTVTVVQTGTLGSKMMGQTSANLADLPIDGVVIVRVAGANPEQITIPDRLPVISLDSSLRGIYPSVVIDQPGSTTEIVNHLVELGHRKIHHVMGAWDSEPAIARRDQYLNVLDQGGISFSKVWDGDWTMESGYRAGQQIAEDPEVTAVFCANDEMAFGVIRALHDAGLRVPEDVSVAGFDGAALAALTSPPLTTIHQDFHSIAEVAVEKLIGEVEGRHKNSLEPYLMPSELVIRDSTCPPSRHRLSSDTEHPGTGAK